MSSRAFIQQAVFATPGGDMDFLFTYHIVDFIRIDARCIDYTFRLKHAPVRVDFIPIFCFPDIQHLCIKSEFHTIRTGILSKRDIHAERTYNSG